LKVSPYHQPPANGKNVRGINFPRVPLQTPARHIAGHKRALGTSPNAPSATTAHNGRERAPPLRRRPDTRRAGDNGTPPRKPGPGSAEARTGKASCGLKESRRSFRVRLRAAALCSCHSC
jgi:hypothetical protein